MKIAFITLISTLMLACAANPKMNEDIPLVNLENREPAQVGNVGTKCQDSINYLMRTAADYGFDEYELDKEYSVIEPSPYFEARRTNIKKSRKNLAKAQNFIKTYCSSSPACSESIDILESSATAHGRRGAILDHYRKEGVNNDNVMPLSESQKRLNSLKESTYKDCK